MKNLICLIVFGIIACSSNTKTIEIQNQAGIVVERYEQNVATQQKEGKSEIFSADGKLLEVAFYKDGKLHGKRELYHENGRVQAIELYQMGRFNGAFQAFYANGQLELVGNYADGKMDGKWKRYYNSGELMEIVTFVENEENGPFIEYHKNGEPKAEGAYLNGDNEHGELKLFDEGGALIKTMNCTKGICRTSWTKNSEEKKI